MKDFIPALKWSFHHGFWCGMTAAAAVYGILLFVAAAGSGDAIASFMLYGCVILNGLMARREWRRHQEGLKRLENNHG